VLSFNDLNTSFDRETKDKLIADQVRLNKLRADKINTEKELQMYNNDNFDEIERLTMQVNNGRDSRAVNPHS
jgi:hypothetical protein